MTHYRALDADLIVQTARRLEQRIAARFPGSGLSQVAQELVGVAEGTRVRISVLCRPRWGLRIAVGLLVVLILVVAVLLVGQLRLPSTTTEFGPFVQLIESAINDAVFIGIAIAFLVTVELRLRRRGALRALHELRSIVHIVDMHQLTKDPDQFLSEPANAASVPERRLTQGQLSRYLDYCTELLSISGKVSALYAQQIDDPVVLAAVNEVESLTAGLANKIWQKLVIMETAASDDRVRQRPLPTLG